MKFAQVALMDEEGRYVWSGSLLRFAHDNQMLRSEVREVTTQFRTENAPAYIGGGSTPEFSLLLSE